MSGDGVNAMLLGDITVGTRRQYAEQSKSWTSGHKTEDELLQRIWNLSGDSLALADALAVTVAERDRLAKALQGVTLDLRMIQQSTPHDRGCDEPDDPTCAACVAASGLARLDEDALAAAGSGGNTHTLDAIRDALAECLWDEEPWLTDDLTELIERVYVMAGGNVDEPPVTENTQ